MNMQSNFQSQNGKSSDGLSSNIKVQSQNKNNSSFHPKFSSQIETRSQIDLAEKIEEKEKPKKIVSFLDGVITTSLVALFFGMPLFFVGLTFQGLNFEKQIYFYFWVLIALVAWSFKGVIAGEMKIRRTPLDYPVLFFVLVYILATLFSIDRWHSFFGFFGDPSRGLMSVIGMVFVYYIIVSHYSKKRLFKMLGSLAISNFFLAVWAISNFMAIRFFPESLTKIIPSSTIGALSGLGIFLGMMLPIITLLILNLKSAEEKGNLLWKNLKVAFYFCTLLLNLFILLIIFSFVSWVGIMVYSIGMGLFVLYILARIVRPSENWTWVPMALFVSLLSIWMIGNINISKVTLPVEVSPSTNLSWEVSGGSIKNYFFLGSGPASYGYSFSKFHPQSFNADQFFNLRFYQASGLFFEAISTIGIIGVIAFLLLLLTFVGSGIYMLSIQKQKNKLYSLGIFSAATVVTLSALVGRIEGPVLILGILVSALSMAVMLSESEASEGYFTLSLKASPKYALALAFVFMVVSAGVIFLFVFLGKVFIADLRAGSAVRETQISENGSVSELEQAIGWYSNEGRYFTRISQEYLVLANNEALKGQKDRNVETIRNYLQASIALAKQGRDMMPKDALAEETLAQTYENASLYVTDSLQLSEDSYVRASELEPHNPIYLVKLGQIKLAKGSLKNNNNPDDIKSAAKEASVFFQKAIDEKQNLDLAYFQLSLTQEIQSDLSGAISSMGKALSLNEKNINYRFNLARLYQARGNDEDKKIAEILYKQILEKNDKDANVHFSLGLLYEKMKRTSDAIAEYKKVLELLPSEQKETRAQVQKMIDNTTRGIENTIENIKQTPVDQQASQEIQAPDLIQGGTGQ